jgi:hypothetical protein
MPTIKIEKSALALVKYKNLKKSAGDPDTGTLFCASHDALHVLENIKRIMNSCRTVATSTWKPTVVRTARNGSIIREFIADCQILEFKDHPPEFASLSIIPVIAGNRTEINCLLSFFFK